MYIQTTMKTATLILFQLPRTKKKITMDKACKLYRKLYGYNNYSYYGRYRTRVKGLLDEIKAIRIFKSAIIVKNEDAQRVIELLQQYEAHIVCKKVILNKEEIEILGL